MAQLNIESQPTRSVRNNTVDVPLWPTMPPEPNADCHSEPTKAEIFLQLGILYWRRGSFERSEQLLTKAREVSNDNKNVRFLAQCFIGLALVKNSLKKPDDAITAYKQAIALTPENTHLWNSLGSLYLKHRKFDQALDAFKKALKHNPGDITAWIGLANTYDRNGSVDEAIKAYKRAIDILPDPKTEVRTADVRKPASEQQTRSLWMRLAVLYTKKSQYQKAIDAYKHLLVLGFDNANNWNELGALYIKIEDYATAAKALSKALELNANCGQAHLNLAIAFAKLGRYQESVPHYLESIGLLKNRQSKAQALDLMEEAIHAVQKRRSVRATKRSSNLRMSTYSPNDFTWFYYKYNEEITSVNFSNSATSLECMAVRTAEKFTNPTANISDVQKSDRGEKEMPYILPLASAGNTQAKRESMPARPQVQAAEHAASCIWNEKGNEQFNTQAYDEAIASYNKALEIDPTFGQPYNNLALIYFTQGDYSKAILMYEKSIKLLTNEQEKAIAWNGLGNVYRCIKDYESARAAYQNAAELDKANGGVYDNTISYKVNEKDKTADFWNELGKLLFKTGAYDKAASAFQKAIRIAPSSGQSYGYLARALTAQGQYHEAVSLYHKSIDLIPNEKEKANAWNRLGDVHRKLNDYDNARKAYQNGTALTNNEFSLLSRTRLSLLSNCAAKG